MGEKTFIFIGGVHKSGTSLLHEILRSHPEISGFSNTGVPEDEGQLLQSVYPPAFTYGGAGRFGFHEESHMEEHHPLATQENAEALFTQWGQYWDLNKHYLIEKSPPNILKTRFLQHLFPNSRFIILFRHPIAVAFATRKWRTTSIPSLIDHTLRCYESFLLDLPLLSGVHLLRYEEFVNDPQSTLQEICSWIGIKPHSFRYEITPHINQAYFEQWSDYSGAFRKVHAWEERANVFGYSLLNPGQLLPARFMIPDN